MKRLLGRLLLIGLAAASLVLPGQVLTAIPQTAVAVDDSFTTDYPFPTLGKGGKSTQSFNSEQLAGIKIDIKKATKIKIDILVTDYVLGDNVGNDQDEFFIKNSDFFADLWNMSFGISWGGSRAEFNETLFLNKGTYYFGLRGASSGIVNFTISDWEQYDETYPEEYVGINNGFLAADPIAVDQKVLGFAPGISESSSSISSLDDADFYYIDVKEDGHYLVESDKPINILKQDESSVGSFGSYGSESESVFLPKGK